ncbi:SAM-dependent methyltransferase [Kushneria indalinina]|uniref:Nodulation protein S (NodS) n=1 Tax=Kushneria indalinina DSM 14324 TaxID=1122140 RepID=A0A3D9DWU8_9GAMM|nr:SAM-dependent methyltransferase [Kushneria indalinina]REC94784.1 nodulation protein S (NodS) [Kushneria indalinina DSM 14324]
MTRLDAQAFEQLHARYVDPWRYHTRWYEKRKRDLTMAMLARERYRRAFEPGCSIGVLSAALAKRCDALWIQDVSDSAVARACETLGGLDHVSITGGAVPEQWPEGRFDLIVISEMGYYLSREALTTLCARIDASLSDDGELLACHWRHPIDGSDLNADSVHDTLGERLGYAHHGHYQDRDTRIDLWQRTPSPVAARQAFGNEGQ